jgi:hypothetical protein
MPQIFKEILKKLFVAPKIYMSIPAAAVKPANGYVSALNEHHAHCGTQNHRNNNNSILISLRAN